MALLARSPVMPSYGLVRMKCGSCESCITYSSSIITYRPSSWRLSAIHDAISTPFHWVCAGFISSRLALSSMLSVAEDGVTSITLPGMFLSLHICCIASNPRYFHDDSITISALVSSTILFSSATVSGSKKDPYLSFQDFP